MKTIELRRGNILISSPLRGEQIIVVNSIAPGYVQDKKHTVYTFIEITPLSLSPDVFKACGFEVIGDGYPLSYRFNINSGVQFAYYEQDGFLRLQSIGSGWTSRLEHIVSLHQLQNFYHAYTGTELLISFPNDQQ